MKKNIRTIKELKQERQKLKIQAEASKQLFFESLTETRTSATDFALNKIIIPAGAVGATLWGAKKIFGNAQGKQNGQAPSTNGKSLLASMLPKLLPLGISLVNAYFTKQVAEEVGPGA